jgi:hypothetical protein
MSLGISFKRFTTTIRVSQGSTFFLHHFHHFNIMYNILRERSFDRRPHSGLGRNKNSKETEQADENSKRRQRGRLQQRGWSKLLLLGLWRKLLGLFLTIVAIIAIRTSTGATRGLRAISKSPGPSNGNQHLGSDVQGGGYLDIDFEGGGNEDIAYRLGDVFAQWINIGNLWLYNWRYPNTLAHQFMLEIPDVEHGKRNLTAFLHVIDRVLAGVDQDPPEDYCHDEEDSLCSSNPCSDKWRCRKSCGTCYKWQNLRDIETPSDNELVVHLRLGDVLTEPKYNEVDKTMEELWNRKQGFLCVANGNQKYNYNKWEFLKIIGRIPPSVRKKFTKCKIVGAGFRTVHEHADRNEDYKRLVFELLESELGCVVETFSGGSPDRDLLYMASSNYFIAAMGGYAQLAAACVTAKRGWGHALYDNFDGKLGNPFFYDVKTNEYIDWSQVDYQPPIVKEQKSIFSFW